MFYLIHFDNIESEETQHLLFELNRFQNGTILSYCQRIRIKLPIDKWIVFIDKDIIERNNILYQSFSKINGIKSFSELDIQHTIYDKEWKWDDDYIKNIFKDVL